APAPVASGRAKPRQHGPRRSSRSKTTARARRTVGAASGEFRVGGGQGAELCDFSLRFQPLLAERGMNGGDWGCDFKKENPQPRLGGFRLSGLAGFAEGA